MLRFLMFSTEPVLEKGQVEKRYRSLITVLVSAFALGMDFIIVIDHYFRHARMPLRSEVINLGGGFILLILFVKSLRELLPYLENQK